jgi:hypothetical protein
MVNEPSPHKKDNDRVLGALVEALKKNNLDTQTSLKLPGHVHFRLAGGCCEILMGKYKDRDQDWKYLVSENMQVDDAAFEGWALALQAWLGCRVKLAWEPPPNKDDKHYQRFLYRVIHLMPATSWFEVKDECRRLLAASRVRDAIREETPASFIVNEPLTHRGTVPLEERDDEKKHEISFFENDDDRASLISYSGLVGIPEIFRQIPVGLFSEKLGDGTPRIFPGGASMIDLAAIDENNTVAIFELKFVKPGSSPKIGAISELLFYSHFIRDSQKGIFVYPAISDKAMKRLLDPERDKTSDRVNAYVLTNKLHPLLNNIKVFEALNEVFSPLQEFGFISYEGPAGSIKCH